MGQCILRISIRLCSSRRPPSCPSFCTRTATPFATVSTPRSSLRSTWLRITTLRALSTSMTVFHSITLRAPTLLSTSNSATISQRLSPLREESTLTTPSHPLRPSILLSFTDFMTLQNLSPRTILTVNSPPSPTPLETRPSPSSFQKVLPQTTSMLLSTSLDHMNFTYFCQSIPQPKK